MKNSCPHVCSNSRSLALLQKTAPSTASATLRSSKSSDLYGFELNVHILTILTGFQLRISVQLSPFEKWQVLINNLRSLILVQSLMTVQDEKFFTNQYTYSGKIL